MKVDLYRARVLGAALRREWPQRALQVLLLLGYMALALLGWGLDGIPGIPELHPRMYTHATTLLFWVFWMMGLVLLVPVLGRAWCGICPLGLATDLLGRRGLGVPWPRWLKSGWAVLAIFALGVAGVVAAGVHKSPHGTAVLITAVGVLAVLSALVWKRSAFCRGLCPVGGVLHLYSRHAPLRVGPVAAEKCRECRDRSCTTPEAEWRRWDLGNLVLQRKIYRAGCPVALYPPNMDSGACLLCLRCVRRCAQGNLGVFWGEKPAVRRLDPSRVPLFVLLTGLVALALLRTWPDLRNAITPDLAANPWWPALWLAAGMPLLLLLGPSLAGRCLAWVRGHLVPGPEPGAQPDSPPRSRQRMALLLPYLPAFIGPVLGAHAALAVVKLNAKAAYLPYLAYDPLGAATYLAVHLGGQLPVPDLLLPLPYLRWAALLCFGLGVLGGAREAWQGWPRAGDGAGVAWGYGATFVLLSGLLGSALVHWLF